MNEHPNMGLTNNRIIKRRKVLTGVSAVGVGMIAGCAETDNLDNNGSDDNESSEDEDRNQHDIGESFEIGSEGNSIRYVLEEATLAERIETSSYNIEAVGVYLIVILRMENMGDNSILVTSGFMSLVDSQGREFERSTETRSYINRDSRFDVEALGTVDLRPGLEQKKAIAFEIPSGESYALKIEPATSFSGAEDHYVALGNVPEP